MAGAQLAEGELEEDSGFAEAGRRLEEHQRMLFERGGQLDLGRLLAGAQDGEGRMETEVPQAFPGAQAEIEELGDALELDPENRLVGGRERDGLGESALSLDEHQFRAERGIGVRRSQIGDGRSGRISG